MIKYLKVLARSMKFNSNLDLNSLNGIIVNFFGGLTFKLGGNILLVPIILFWNIIVFLAFLLIFLAIMFSPVIVTSILISLLGKVSLIKAIVLIFTSIYMLTIMYPVSLLLLFNSHRHIVDLGGVYVKFDDNEGSCLYACLYLIFDILFVLLLILSYFGIVILK